MLETDLCDKYGCQERIQEFGVEIAYGKPCLVAGKDLHRVLVLSVLAADNRVINFL